jgi:hypothetical protein
VSDNKQLFIPDRLNVGFVKRDDTYTGKLAYVIYWDKKGALRKEKSWQSWRDKKIAPKEFDNVPTDGFVLNKKVGGYKSEWNFRDAHIRVYDPRDFEFEISVANLLFILREADCSRGKGLEGRFVYAWDRDELVLLPVDSDEYKKSKAFTDLQGLAVKGKELLPGATYLTKKQEELVFVGRYDYHYVVRRGGDGLYDRASPKDDKGFCKKYVFWRPGHGRAKPATYYHSGDAESAYLYLDTPAKIGALKSDVPHPDFAKLVTKYGKSQFGSRVVKLELKPGKPVKDGYYGQDGVWYAEDEPGRFTQFMTSYQYDNKTINHVVAVATFYLDKDGTFVREKLGQYIYPAGRSASRQYNYQTHRYETYASPAWREPTDSQLFATTESGAVIQVGYGNFDKQKG